jgi:hypothetical protein
VDVAEANQNPKKFVGALANRLHHDRLLDNFFLRGNP